MRQYRNNEKVALNMTKIFFSMGYLINKTYIEQFYMEISLIGETSTNIASPFLDPSITGLNYIGG